MVFLSRTLHCFLHFSFLTLFLFIFKLQTKSLFFISNFIQCFIHTAERHKKYKSLPKSINQNIDFQSCPVQKALIYILDRVVITILSILQSSSFSLLCLLITLLFVYLKGLLSNDDLVFVSPYKIVSALMLLHDPAHRWCC